MSYPAAQSMVRMGVPWRVVLGGVLVLAGLGLIVFAVSMREDSPLFILGGILVGGGALRVTTALAAEARRRREHPVDPSDPRWYDGIAPMQLAGRTCVECGRKIVIGADAVSCEQCAQPEHIDCRDAHKAHAHPVVRFEDPTTT